MLRQLEDNIFKKAFFPGIVCSQFNSIGTLKIREDYFKQIICAIRKEVPDFWLVHTLNVRTILRLNSIL